MAYNELTHFDDSGNAVMVDVSGKNITERIAAASGSISMNEAAFEAVVKGTAKKGDVLGVARVAGIMAVKKTSELIPLCHPLPIRKIGIDFALHPESRTVSAVCTVKTEDKTGVEMEALTGVSVALLTVYDMLKAVDKRMEINAVHLDEKHGGKSGDFMR
ncbi:MAG: cyclic pyranopterin monophosphate synthase MoaC [Lachnospiraceae bacterium]|nr:cyclic pyranopterin monophosphate synthase MoaC [Lachnospiraceae bacterium]